MGMNSGKPAEDANATSATGAGTAIRGARIAERQNDPWSLDLLAAQRQLYREAKRWRQLRTWSVSASALAAFAATIFAPDLLKVVGPLGAALLLIQYLAGQFEKGRTAMGALVQELFDTSVYPLPWNDINGPRPDPEEVVAAAAHFRGDRTKLANWYTVPGDVRYPLDVLLCQRCNLRWDVSLRRAYADTIVVCLIVLFLAIAAAGVLRILSMGDWLLAVLATIGAFVLGVETVIAHREHAREQTEFKAIVQTAWEKACSQHRPVPANELHAIQDRIYRLRAIAPPVPEWFYHRKRAQQEIEMRRAAEQMATEIQP